MWGPGSFKKCTKDIIQDINAASMHPHAPHRLTFSHAVWTRRWEGGHTFHVFHVFRCCRCGHQQTLATNTPSRGTRRTRRMFCSISSFSMALSHIRRCQTRRTDFDERSDVSGSLRTSWRLRSIWTFGTTRFIASQHHQNANGCDQGED